MCYWARSWDCNCKFILSICAFPLAAESRYNLCSSSFLVPEFCIIYCTGWEFQWHIHTPAYPGKMVVGKYRSKSPCVEDTMHRLKIRCDSVISFRPNGHPQWSGIHSTVFLLAPLPPQTVFWFLGAIWYLFPKKPFMKDLLPNQSWNLYRDQLLDTDQVAVCLEILDG